MIVPFPHDPRRAPKMLSVHSAVVVLLANSSVALAWVTVPAPTAVIVAAAARVSCISEFSAGLANFPRSVRSACAVPGRIWLLPTSLSTARD